MPSCQRAVRPLTRYLQQSSTLKPSKLVIRSFTTTSQAHDEAETVTKRPTEIDPFTVMKGRDERRLMKTGVLPVGSRRRRAALRTSENIPFEQLPFQCFQEARKVLAQDREEKLRMIKTERLRIASLVNTPADKVQGGERTKNKRLLSMRNYLEYLKIQADINDPIIKKRFEDGLGDMDKPIYRYLADKKWREYQRKVIVQRIEQLGIVPDVLPSFEPTADVKLAFRSRKVQPGEFVDSRISEVPCRLNVQVFDKGERLVTVVVMDNDIPLAELDSFGTRCHFIATDLPISPTNGSLPLTKRDPETQIALPWLSPYAQKGSPYHRYTVWVLEQDPEKKLDMAKLKALERDNFDMRSFVSKFSVKPIGMAVFRSIWDEGTTGVMKRNGVEGADIEFKRKRVIALKPKEKKRGWEARHSSDKYKPLGMASRWKK